MKRRVAVALLGLAVLVAAVLGGWAYWRHQAGAAGGAAGVAGLVQEVGAIVGLGAAPVDYASAEQTLKTLQQIVQAHRQMVVLFAQEDLHDAADAARAKPVGQALFHENRARIAGIEHTWELMARSQASARFEAFSALLDYMESDAALMDADRLAFFEVLRALQVAIARDTTLPAIKLHKRIGEDLDALAEIERTYDKEIHQIFDRFDTRAIVLKREKWADYVASLQKQYNREQILKDFGVVTPYPLPPESSAQTPVPKVKEFFGTELPPKTIVLTFDDGPHRSYTNEIAAILKQYSAPAVFFAVGSNLGSLDAQGKPQLGSLAGVSKGLLAQGHAIGNHSLTHAQLSKRAGADLEKEILGTDALLKAVDGQRSSLFRFPYGAHNAEGLRLVANAQLQSIMWNIDSMDWADPVPNSIAQRVLQTVEKEGRGIVLFHDIHERTVKALPLVLERLRAEGYQFAGWDGKAFTYKQSSTAVAREATPLTANQGYTDSWAIVVGINDYAKWPKLHYAVRDAQSMREALIQNLGFAPDHVISLENKEATRHGLLSAFHDKLVHSGMKKNDRLLVFFAGHGATQRLSSGRDLGYIIPVDSDPAQMATDAIPMTELQNIAENITAKHALFIMDACYSGLGLTRGGGASNFLRDNAKRIGRQMLTAGGADQLVADGGPNGHSVFTWALLQGLGGKADFNGDGIITATELAAYVSPAVAAVSPQTPAFGSLPGSQGGDFVFTLPVTEEFISAQTAQLPTDAIALNGKFDASKPAVAPPPLANQPMQLPATTTVVIKNLQGADQKIVTSAAVPASTRQLAQRANDRGLLLFKEKRYAQAEAQFTEALKLRPDFSLAANNLGFVLYRQDKFKEAARWFENTLRLDPSRAVAHLNLGDALFKAGEGDNAKKAYTTYLELAPQGAGAGYARQQVERL